MCSICDTLWQNPNFCSKNQVFNYSIFGGKIQIQCWSRFQQSLFFGQKLRFCISVCDVCVHIERRRFSLFECARGGDIVRRLVSFAFLGRLSWWSSIFTDNNPYFGVLWLTLFLRFLENFVSWRFRHDFLFRFCNVLTWPILPQNDLKWT